MKNKRGISPLIATVLLVAIVIILGVLIYFWYTDVLKDQTEKEQLTSELICAQKIEFSLSQIQCLKSTDDITFKVENTGSANIDKFDVIVTDSEGNVLATVQTGSGVRYPETSQLSVPTSDLNLVTSIDIEVIPIIINQGAATECTSKTEVAYSRPC